MTPDETLRILALTCIPRLGSTTARRLIKEWGSATAVFEHRKEASRLPGIGPRMAEALNNTQAFVRAEQELRFCEKNHIRCLSVNDEDYPSRLRECPDAPLVLFYRGKADLNARRIISLVGTRQATPYGQELCERFLAELAERCPDVVVVSGLAYGIDIHAHRAALLHRLPTIGVLAHGLDRIYPAVHRKTAVEMLEQGGLLTEFMSGTTPDRQNFVMRNRIVAGMCDATIIVESAAKGGALITADLSIGYHRECFAFPGRINDEYSVGCNHLIRNNQAALITSADDFVAAIRWDDTPTTKSERPIQRALFVELTPDEEQVVHLLQKYSDGLQINTLVVEANLPVNKMSALLFELEMKGVVRNMVGGVYRLID